MVDLLRVGNTHVGSAPIITSLLDVGSTFNPWNMLPIPFFSFVLDSGAFVMALVAGSTIPILTINTEELKSSHWNNTQTHLPLHDVYKLYPLSYAAYNYIDDAGAKSYSHHHSPEFRDGKRLEGVVTPASIFTTFNMSQIILDNSAKAKFQNFTVDAFKVPNEIQSHFTREHHFAKSAGLLLFLAWSFCVISNWVVYLIWQITRPNWHWRRMLWLSIGNFVCCLSTAALLTTEVERGEAVFKKYKDIGVYAKGDGGAFAIVWIAFVLTFLSMSLWFLAVKTYHQGKEAIRRAVQPQPQDSGDDSEDDGMRNIRVVHFPRGHGGGIELHEMPPIPEENESIISASVGTASPPSVTVLPDSSESSKNSSTEASETTKDDESGGVVL